MTSPSTFSCACITNTGHKRTGNQDNFVFFGTVMPQLHQSSDEALTAVAPRGATAVVAVLDGMGGELAGEAASFVAATQLNAITPTLGVDEASMGDAFRTMQDAVQAMRVNRRLSSTGTTATVLAYKDGAAIVGNLGDSQAFLVRDGMIRTLSVSHTDEEVVRRLGLSRKPVLTQFLGVDETDAPIEPHIARVDLEAGDRLILASDGLTDMVDTTTILGETIGAPDMKTLVTRLCEQALTNGGIDNVTVIACEVLA